MTFKVGQIVVDARGRPERISEVRSDGDGVRVARETNVHAADDWYTHDHFRRLDAQEVGSDWQPKTKGYAVVPLARLREIEFAGGDGMDYVSCCPVCLQPEADHAHSPDCWLAATINEDAPASR